MQALRQRSDRERRQEDAAGWQQRLTIDVSDVDTDAVLRQVDVELHAIPAIFREAVILRYLRGLGLGCTHGLENGGGNTALPLLSPQQRRQVVTHQQRCVLRPFEEGTDILADRPHVQGRQPCLHQLLPGQSIATSGSLRLVERL